MVTIEQWRSAIGGFGGGGVFKERSIRMACGYGPANVNFQKWCDPLIDVATLLAQLEEESRMSFREVTAGMAIHGHLDPPTTGDNCPFYCLAALCSMARASGLMSAQQLAVRVMELAGVLEMEAHILLRFIEHLSDECDLPTMLSKASREFPSEDALAAVQSFRKLALAACELGALPATRAVTDEWYLDLSDTKRALSLGQKVPLGLVATLVELLPFRVAFLTESDGQYSRRDIGNPNVPLLGGLVVRKEHCSLMLVSEAAALAQTGPTSTLISVEYPVKSEELTIVFHRPGGESFDLGVTGCMTVIELNQIINRFMPTGGWRLVLNGRSAQRGQRDRLGHIRLHAAQPPTNMSLSYPVTPNAWPSNSYLLLFSLNPITSLWPVLPLRTCHATSMLQVAWIRHSTLASHLRHHGGGKCAARAALHCRRRGSY